MAIAQDATANANGTAGSASVSLNHAANVLIVVSISFQGASITSVTIGGTTATNLSTQGKCSVYYLFVSGAANDTVTVTTASGLVAFTATSLTGTATSTPFFEGTASASSLSVIVAAGTTGRRVIMACGSFFNSYNLGTGDCTGACGTVCPTLATAPGAGQTEIGETNATSTAGSCAKGARTCTDFDEEVNYKDTAGSITMTATATASCENPILTLASIGSAILPFVVTVTISRRFPAAGLSNFF